MMLETMIGIDMGRVSRQNCCAREQPSSRAASSTSCGRSTMYERIRKIVKGMRNAV